MNAIFELIKTILGFFDAQLVAIFNALRIKKPSVYLSVVSVLMGGSYYLTEAVKSGTLKLNDTGLFAVWLVSFLLSILTRPAIGTQSIESTPKTSSKAIEINSPSDIKL